MSRRDSEASSRWRGRRSSRDEGGEGGESEERKKGGEHSEREGGRMRSKEGGEERREGREEKEGRGWRRRSMQSQRNFKLSIEAILGGVQLKSTRRGRQARKGKKAKRSCCPRPVRRRRVDLGAGFVILDSEKITTINQLLSESFSFLQQHGCREQNNDRI